MSSLKSIGIDVGVIAKGLNYKVSLFNQRLSDTETKVSTLPFEPSDITDWESCGCGDIDTIPSALDKLAELRALTADRVTVLEQGGGTNGQDGADGTDGTDGASAYEIAVGNGFTGTEAEWLESLKGEDGANGTNGTNGTNGNDGDSAYQVAVSNGFTGTEAEWLESLKGSDGSTYQVYTKDTLPLSMADGGIALVSDGSVSGTPVLSYFYQGKYYRSFDNTVLSNQIIDIYLLAGQSNAHGHADVSTLSIEEATQDGLFYSSWHETTSNASTTQYYSDWASSLVAGSTRGDDNVSVLGGSSKFGPEIGFIKRANEILLSGDKPIGVLKHAIGASTLTDVGDDYSDWDITATGDRRGDALRAFKRSVEDGLSKLDSAGHSYRIAGLIWWQGESGSSVNDLNDLLDHLRDYLDTQFTLDMPKSEFPIVITKIGYGTDLTPVADGNAYVGIVDAANYGHSNTQNHVGDPSDGSADNNSNGVNDMLEIGEAYADMMQSAIAGNTMEPWNPENMTTSLWLDANDESTLTIVDDNVTIFSDKSGNNFDFNASSSATLTSVSSAQNNKNILRFDNGSDATSKRLINFDKSKSLKWFFVLKVTQSNNHDCILELTGSRAIMLFNLSGNGVFKADWYTNSNIHIQDASLPNLLDEWVLLSVEFDIPNTIQRAWLNGTQYSTDRTNTGLADLSTSSQVRLGVHQNYADFDLGEIIFTEGITDADTEKIEGYLAHKWGLTNSLPSAHPYKTQMPQ